MARLLARITDLDRFVDWEAIRRFAGNAPAPIYYLAGPPAAVQAIKWVPRHVELSNEDEWGYAKQLREALALGNVQRMQQQPERSTHVHS